MNAIIMMSGIRSRGAEPGSETSITMGIGPIRMTPAPLNPAVVEARTTTTVKTNSRAKGSSRT
ncbi:MAG: hypothetical protein QXS50_01490 [Candidatus Caldarchaeum sp.]